MVFTHKVTCPRDETLEAFPELSPKKGRAGKAQARPMKQYLWSKRTAVKAFWEEGHAHMQAARWRKGRKNWSCQEKRAPALCTSLFLSHLVAPGPGDVGYHGQLTAHSYQSLRSQGLYQVSAPLPPDPPGVSVSPVERRSVRTSFLWILQEPTSRQRALFSARLGYLSQARESVGLTAGKA